MAQGDFAPEMMSSTKLSTVSAQRGRDGKGMRRRGGQAVGGQDRVSENVTLRSLGPQSS